VDNDGQRKRVAHMPTATTTKDDSRSKLVQKSPTRLHQEALEYQGCRACCVLLSTIICNDLE
jgi:hypothetical protein